MKAVRDIMRTDVVTVRADDSARTLARLLSDSEISGVPVLDSAGTVLGVASATDLVRLAADESDVRLSAAVLRPDIGPAQDPEADEDRIEADPYGFFLPEDSPFQGTEFLRDFPETSFDAATVEDLMTSVTFSVNPDMSIPELCDYLVRGRIHRALVIEDGELVGIVTSQDVMRAIANQSISV